MFTIAVSCLAAIVDITLLKFLIFVSRFRKALAPRIERWIQDGILQLQRRAYEAQGASTWTYLEKDVPVTVGKDQLPDLPVETMPPRIHSMHLELDRSWTAMTNMSSGSSLAKYSVDGPGKRLLKRSTSF